MLYKKIFCGCSYPLRLYTQYSPVWRSPRLRTVVFGYHQNLLLITRKVRGWLVHLEIRSWLEETEVVSKNLLYNILGRYTSFHHTEFSVTNRILFRKFETSE